MNMKSPPRLVSGLALILAAAPVYGQSEALITNARARQVASLNGTWQVIVDPYETGFYDHLSRPLNAGYWTNRKPRDRTDRVEYDFDTSGSLLVPGDWNSQRQALFFYEGTVWYKRDFDYELAPGRRLFVYFGAANYETTAWMNGEQMGAHEGGFTPFNFEITDRVREVGNYIILKVDNKRRFDGVPAANTDWWNYGGLTRDVFLVDVPETFIRDYFLQLDPGSPDHVAGWVQLDGSQPRQSVAVRVPEAGLETVVETDADGYSELRFGAALERWSPQNPKLYDIELEAETDRLTDRIGFRTIATHGHDLLLNGEPIFLRGICIHEQAPQRDGRAFTEQDARTLLGWAKELNANFVRLAHYPHNEYLTRQADEMGLLVWAEIPVYWTMDWENPATLQNARNQLTEVITRDKNRASVILWSMANETPFSQERLDFLITLTETARALDPTRLLTSALFSRYIDETTVMVDDPFGAYLDVVAVNEYVGWYDGLPEKADRLSWRMDYEKPLVMSEFGAGALQGFRGDSLTRWTEEYQASVYRHQVEMLKRIPFLRGTAPWILTDFRSPRRALPGIQDYWNRKGLISDRGLKKQAFHVLREFYEDIARN
ncbi:MAG: glycoside hydrolase family 2 TIM barrel-domain containing protein [Gemmatimonadales bacterium]|jgi:beta-glucuronidase